MSNRIDEIKNELLGMPEVIRFKELEGYINKNERINTLFSQVKEKQKQMINAKEFNQHNQYNIYNKEYNDLLNELYNLPFVEEYLELVDIINQKLGSLSFLIEKELENKMK
ncbi:MAG: YlbF family regulator [Anaeroplasma sp.]|nr:YlbF family regulator [Anaeroplasma sp.]